MQSKSFLFEFPLIISYATAGGKKTTNNGSIIIKGDCFEDWLGIAVAENIEYELSEGTSFNAYKHWEDVMGTASIDRAIQQHIEGLLRGDFSYDTTTDQQQDLPDIFNAIANVINPAA